MIGGARRMLAVDRERCRSCGLRFSVLSLGANLALAVLKVAVGLLSGSKALLAGALYSINDVLSAIAVAVSLRISGRPATDEHPYGQGKAEFIAVGMVSLVLAVGVFAILAYSVFDIVRGVKEPPHFVAAVVAALSLVCSELLHRRAACAADRLGSPALRTSAEHNRADAVSSLAVMIGVGGAALGFHSLDQLVAIFEAIHVVGLSGTLLAKSLKGLMDTALPAEDLDMVDRACREVPGVADVASVRTRSAGSQNWIDVAVVVQRDLSVAEAHEVTRMVETTIHRILGPSARAQVRFQGGRDLPANPSTVESHA